MALISLSTLRGVRLALLNPCPYPQLPLASRRSTKLNLRSKSITVSARYSQTQDFFTSRLQGASSLNSSNCYILHNDSTVFTWAGNLTNIEDQELVERQLDMIKAGMLF